MGDNKSLRCPYCGSDRVIPVNQNLEVAEGFYCRDCGMEWGEEDQAREEIKKE